MCLVTNRISGKTVTRTTDHQVTERVTVGFEQLRIWPDTGVTNYYWHLGRLRLGEQHPYNEGAAEHLRDQPSEPVETYQAGTPWR